MIRNLFLSLSLFLALISNVSAQDKAFFDKQGKSVSQDMAYYYRENLGSNNYRSKYIAGDGLYFEGQIIEASSDDESLNKFTGTCTWYYKNTRKKSVKSYNESGVLHGLSVSYYESGNVSREEDYVNGYLKDGLFLEYDESGRYSKIFKESFIDNYNDWDVYEDAESVSRIADGALYMQSLIPNGTCRMKNVPLEFENFSVEATVNLGKQTTTKKAGLIFGFKDWDNYWYFTVSRDRYYIGVVFEGLTSTYSEGEFISGQGENSVHSLKVITADGKWFFSVDGSVQKSVKDGYIRGRNVGFIVNGKATYGTFDNLIVKEFYDGSAKDPNAEGATTNIKSTGTGLMVTGSGYIVTNYHVIEGTGSIFVDVKTDAGTQSYKAVVVQSDKQNDLAVIKIDDPKYVPLPSAPFSLKTAGGIESGSSVFTIGYPLALSGMGVEPKFSDGKISAKTGYDGAINAFQTTIPVQPGNSGGPVFNSKGELLGIINAKIMDSDNVSYAIKSSYVLGLIDVLPETLTLTETSQIATLSVEEQVKRLRSYVVLIKIK